MRLGKQQQRCRQCLRRLAGAALVLYLSAGAPTASAQTAAGSPHWVGTWATVPVARCPGHAAGQLPQDQGRRCDQGSTDRTGQGQTPPPPAQAPLPVLNNQTLRQIVRVSVGGDRVRVVLTNAYGTAPVVVGAAQVALRAKDRAILPQSARALTFSGRNTTTIAPGAVVFSDAVNLTIPALADLAIDLYLPENTAATPTPVTVHAGTGGLQTNYVSETGNHVGAASLPTKETTLAWHFLMRVEVTAADQVGAIVTLGDSITDGSQSSPDTNNRWPDHLARRLAKQNLGMAVLNAGFSGNRVLSDSSAVSALVRFDRDVLAQTGVTHVIVLEGINDIGMARANPSPSAADIIAGHKQLIMRARAQGLKIYGATLTPFEGANYFTKEGEAKRQAVNEWIRTSQEYDGVIDFDAVVRDPGRPAKHLPQYDPGDHLHATDAGYEAMANAINLDWFKAGQRGTPATR
ncbi:MAG: SGNH/GDSL hydrolase family protein [Luteitalea sp.]|nr:SGNH/GDSL hydrolase family protein [Luteitalea sp.]